jgi:hypothetical protein
LLDAAAGLRGEGKTAVAAKASSSGSCKPRSSSKPIPWPRMASKTLRSEGLPQPVDACLQAPAMSPAALASATACCSSGGAFSRSASRRVAMPSTMILVS